MLLRWLLCALCALSAEADFFQLDSISNVSTYYFNYFYCNIWEGDCQPNQDDATQQGNMAFRRAIRRARGSSSIFITVLFFFLYMSQFLPGTSCQASLTTTLACCISGTVVWASAASLETAGSPTTSQVSRHSRSARLDACREFLYSTEITRTFI